MKTLNPKQSQKKSLQAFKKAFKEDSDVNLRTKNGYIFYVGCILTKLKEGHQYFAIDGKWVKV